MDRPVASSSSGARVGAVSARLGVWYRPLMFAAAIVITVVGAAVFAFATAAHAWPVFDDLRIYQDATRRLLAGGSWYLDRQLHGPYPLMHGDVLYPPVIAWFIGPWLVLPALTFVVVPLAILGWHVWDCRPAPWTWPVLAACLVYPTSVLYIVFANPALWMAAFVALALRWKWPGALILLKPSLAPFALLGIRSRGWWATFGLLVALSVPVLAATLRYPSVITDAAGVGIFYSIQGFPIMFVAIVAVAGRTAQPATR